MEIDEQVEPERARELIASNEVEVLDLRDEEQWRERRIPGSRRVDPDDLDAALEEIDSERPLLLVCDQGEQSAQLAAKLRDDGREAGCIEGGIDAWEGDGLALQPSDDVADDAKI